MYKQFMYVFRTVYKIIENVLQIHASKIKAIVVGKIMTFFFWQQKEQIIEKII